MEVHISTVVAENEFNYRQKEITLTQSSYVANSVQWSRHLMNLQLASVRSKYWKIDLVSRALPLDD